MRSRLRVIRKSFWFLPTFYSFIAFLLALFSIELDLRYDFWRELVWIPGYFLTKISHARPILAALVTSMLTMTTITFSSVLVVLTTYSSQFSPRTIQNFVMQQSTQRVIGVFVGAFVYILFILLFLQKIHRDDVLITPALAVIVALIALGYFVYYIHHVSSSIQISNLIDQVTTNTLNAVSTAFPIEAEDKEPIEKEAPWESWESEEIKNTVPNYINANKTGYIQTIDKKKLIAVAKRYDIILRCEQYVGEYVIEGTPLFSYWSSKPKEIAPKPVLDCISAGIERTTEQDIKYGIQKLVEIALRGLSPAINDPNTAIVCVNALGKILTYLGNRKIPTPYVYDDQSNLRLIYYHHDFSHYLYLCFFQIRHYGNQDLSVLTSIIESLSKVAEETPQHIRDQLWKFRDYLIANLNIKDWHSLDQEFIKQKLHNLAKATGHMKHFESWIKEITLFTPH